MRVIIVGAGEIGKVSAETISRVHDVLVIEIDGNVSNQLKSRLNVSTLKGDGSNPKTLRYAIENHDADMIISTINSDAVNLFICLMAKRIRPGIKTVASVKDPDFIIETSADGVDGVDILISPELITAEKMFKLCTLENAVDYESISSLGTSVAVFAVQQDSLVLGSVIMQLSKPAGCAVFAVYRGDDVITEVEAMEIHAGDRICVYGTEESLEEFNRLLGVEFPARNFVLLGGSFAGRNVARLLAAERKNVTIIDRDEQACRDMAKVLRGVSISCADFMDPNVQVNENVFRADATVTTTKADDTNLLLSMTAKRHSARKVITSYFTDEYEDIFRFTGIETIIGFHRIISNEILKCSVSDETAIIRMRDQNELFFCHVVDSGSKLLDQYLGDIIIPEGIKIVAIVRGGETIYPQMDTRILKDDNVIVYTSVPRRSDLVRVFGKSSIPEV